MSRLIIAFVVCSITKGIFAELLQPIVVSLGPTSMVTVVTRSLRVQKTVFPFDWVISPFESVYRAFEDKFTHFLEKGSLRVRSDKQGVMDYYGFEFVHDFPTIQSGFADGSSDEPLSQYLLRPDFLDFYDVVATKYQRRIACLQDAMNRGREIMLIRYGDMNRSQAERLRNLIRKKYPNAMFTLVFISNKKEADWHLGGIKQFYFDAAKNWNDPVQWAAIFRSLGFRLNIAN